MLENADDFVTVLQRMAKCIKNQVQRLSKKRKLSDDDKYYPGMPTLLFMHKAEINALPSGDV